MPPADPYHAFTELLLTITEPTLEHVRTEHRFELRSTASGAEVWRASAVCTSDGGRVESEPRFVGRLGSRQVIELLVEIERSGVYEALPAMGLVEGAPGSDDDERPLVSMSLSSRDATRELIHNVPVDEHSVTGVVRAVRDAIAAAQERALSWAG